MPPRLTPAPHPLLTSAAWLRNADTQTVLAAITAGGGEARIVGGAIRNTLLERPVKDIDIATSIRPEDVIERATAAGLHAIPTGIDHGTVTVVANGTPYEVTTLRYDLETHGRHATVAFTEDWAADARRRDFTINALYCDADGTLYDFVGGLDDLAGRRVRFIGVPQERIEEDYLRILRFYRFTAEYANGAIDRDGHLACSALQAGLDIISAERIRAELMRLLTAPFALLALSEMEESGLLARILGRAADLVTLARLVEIETANAIPPDPVRRLYALAVQTPDAAVHLRDRLRLSKAEYERLADLILPDPAFEPGETDARTGACLYRHGPAAYRDGVLISWARNVAAAGTDPSYAALLNKADTWTSPVLPVGGKDVLALGVKPGPDVGAILSLVEQWWIAAGFPADKAEVHRRLVQAVNLKQS